MAAKRRKKRARKAGTKARKAGTRKRRRKAAGAAPKRRRRALKRSSRRRSSRSRVRRSPARRRSARRRVSARSTVGNPSRRRRGRGRRRSRRNPGIPAWALAGLAALGGLAAFAVSGAGSFALTQRIDPSMATLERNRYIAGGLATVAGLAVAAFTEQKILGAGIAAGGLVGLAGTDLYLAIGKVIDKAPTAPAAAPTKAISGVFEGGQQQLGIGGYFEAGEQQLQGLGYSGGDEQWTPAYASQNRYG
jgi:hypothetical protein